MQLTKNFTLEELTASDTAVRLGINNEPSAATVGNLQRVATALQAIRDQLGNPLLISSGYRSPKLNAAVRGAATSAHLEGRAADFRLPGYGSPAQICAAVARAGLIEKLGIDQLIEEGTWVHIGLPKAGAKPRLQTMTARFDATGRVSYEAGLTRAA